MGVAHVANVLQKCCKRAAGVWQRCGNSVAKRPPLRPRKGLHNRCLAPAPRRSPCRGLESKEAGASRI
eukprot:334874-Alexandrium_andersonii.AAC.1